MVSVTGMTGGRFARVTTQLPRDRDRSAPGFVLALARACHPGPVMAVTLCATGYALAIGRRPKEALRIGVAVATGQLAIGWQNDWIDAARDRAALRLDKPIATGALGRGPAGVAAALAALGTIPASLANGRQGGLSHLGAVASAASYNLKLKSTAYSFLPYAVSFSLLPEFVHLSGDRPEHAPRWAVIGAGALGVAAHLLNVLPDREADLAQGVRGLPQQLSRKADIALAALCLALSSLVITFGPRRVANKSLVALGASLLFAAAALLAAARDDDRNAFRLVLLVALCDVAALLMNAHRDHEMTGPSSETSNHSSARDHERRP